MTKVALLSSDGDMLFDSYSMKIVFISSLIHRELFQHRNIHGIRIHDDKLTFAFRTLFLFCSTELSLDPDERFTFCFLARVFISDYKYEENEFSL